MRHLSSENNTGSVYKIDFGSIKISNEWSKTKTVTGRYLVCGFKQADADNSLQQRSRVVLSVFSFAPVRFEGCTSCGA